jgi:hypothetical protein
LFARRTRAVSALIPELYLHGLAAGDFDLALRGLLGETAPLSARTVARLKARWQGAYFAHRSFRSIMITRFGDRDRSEATIPEQRDAGPDERRSPPC